MLHPRSCAVLALLALVAITPPAHATGEDPIERAKVLFDQGAEAYRAGQFAKAIELLEEAHRLSNEPVLLFNLAKAHEGKGDLVAAVDAYERYLRDAKDIPDRKAIEGRVETLRGQIAATEALRRRAEEERLRRERAEQADRRSASPIPWVIAGVGAAGLSVGGVLAGLAFLKGKESEDEPRQRQAVELKNQGQDLALGANISFAVGGAIAAAGVIWGIVDLSLVASEGQAKLRLGPARASLELDFD